MPSSNQVATYRDNLFITMIRTSIISIALFFEELIIDYRNHVRILCQPDHHLHSFSHNHPLLHNLPCSSSVLGQPSVGAFLGWVARPPRTRSLDLRDHTLTMARRRR